MAKKYVYNKFRLLYNGKPLSINTTEYVRNGNTLVDRATHLATTREEALQLKYAFALTRGIDPNLIVVEPYSSDVKHIQDKPFTNNLNRHLAKAKKFSGVGLKLNTIELPSKYKKGTYQGKTDNNPLSVKTDIGIQVLTSMKTGNKIRRKVDKSGIKSYLSNMKSSEPTHSVYFAQSTEWSKGKSVIMDVPQYREKNSGVNQTQHFHEKIEKLGQRSTVSMEEILLDSLRKKGLGKKKLMRYLRGNGFNHSHAESLIKAL